jgi:signal transduction histidine kinase
MALRQRLESIGGTLDFGPLPAGGVELRGTIPIGSGEDDDAQVG